jgi:SAM-dependent methyltransferase
MRRYVARKCLLEAVNWAAPRFKGRLLDVGCGSMPYREYLQGLNPGIREYIGVDLPQSGYGKPDVEWDGITLPFPDGHADCAMATEVLEHCPQPQQVLSEIRRVLRPGGKLFLTVPFLWPLHCVPHDEYRYTPFSLQRLLDGAGFTDIELQSTGGYNRALASVLCLYFGRPATGLPRRLLQRGLAPIIRYLDTRDEGRRVGGRFENNDLITGIRGFATAGQ